MTMTYMQLTKVCNDIDNELSEVYAENLELKDVIEELKSQIITSDLIITTQVIELDRKRLH